MRILLIEDETRIAENIRTILQHASYAVDVAATCAEASLMAADEPYDLLILDRRLPDGDGKDLLTRLKTEGFSGLAMMLTAKTQLQDIVEGLDAGADDYLPKPFQAPELLARVRSLLRRGPRIPQTPLLTVGDLTIDTNTRNVTRGGLAILLSPKEYALLEFLARHPCQALDRMTIIEHVWDRNADLLTNTIDVHIRFLRKKVDAPFATQIIRTVKGAGYMLCDRDD